MVLIYDEFNDWWVWVDADNHDLDLSPPFDDKEYATKWLDQLTVKISNFHNDKKSRTP